MIQRPTVFVLGAGASKPYNFPLGSELTAEIRQIPENRQIIKELHTDDEIEQFQEALRLSRQPSIDAFLEHRPEFTKVGKICIANALIRREKTHALMKQSDWYDSLLAKLGPTFAHINQNQITIVTFNYDRSLEQYLFTAIRNRYLRSDDEEAMAKTAEAINRLKIIHFYGQIGYLPWQTHGPDDPVREYESTVDRMSLQLAASGIKLVTEDRKENVDRIKAAKAALDNAETIFFLGFGYLQENMKRLGFPRSVDRQRQRGTAFDLKSAERQNFEELYPPLGLGKDDQDCLSYLRDNLDYLRLEREE